MSTSQRAMMLCCWGVKAGMKSCLQVKLSALENATVFKGVLQMSKFTFALLCFALVYFTLLYFTFWFACLLTYLRTSKKCSGIFSYCFANLTVK